MAGIKAKAPSTTKLQIAGIVVAIGAGLSTVGANFPKVKELILGRAPVIDYTYLHYDKNGTDCLISNKSARLGRYYPNESVCHLKLGQIDNAWFVLLKNNGQDPVEEVMLTGESWSGQVGHLDAGDVAMLCAGAQRIGNFIPVDAHVKTLMIKTGDGRQTRFEGRAMPSSAALGETSKACSPFEGAVPNE